MAFSPDGSALATGTYGGAVGLWDPRTREMAAVLRGHKGGLTQVGGGGGRCRGDGEGWGLLEGWQGG